MKTIALLGAALALSVAAAEAQEVTLKAVTVFAEKTTYSKPFERFIERVNQTGKGLVQINYIGGPKAMPPFEIGNALKSGVIDIANSADAFCHKLLAESGPLDLNARAILEIPENGGGTSHEVSCIGTAQVFRIA